MMTAIADITLHNQAVPLRKRTGTDNHGISLTMTPIIAAGTPRINIITRKKKTLSLKTFQPNSNDCLISILPPISSPPLVPGVKPRRSGPGILSRLLLSGKDSKCTLSKGFHLVLAREDNHPGDE